MKAEEIRALVPVLGGSVEDQYKYVRKLLMPQLPKDGEKREFLFAAEGCSNPHTCGRRFIHIYIRDEDCEVWMVTDKEAEEWMAAGGHTPPGWPCGLLSP
jgi:hypothetical protein